MLTEVEHRWREGQSRTTLCGVELPERQEVRCDLCQATGTGRWIRAGRRQEHRAIPADDCQASRAGTRPCLRCARTTDRHRRELRDRTNRRWPEDWGPIRVERA